MPSAFVFASAASLGSVATHAPFCGAGNVLPSNAPHAVSCGMVLQSASAGHAHGVVASVHDGSQFITHDVFACRSSIQSLGDGSGVGGVVSADFELHDAMTV